MSTENTEYNSTKFKVLLGIISVLLILLSVYTFRLYNTSQKTESTLISQKADIETELEELIVNYDEIIQDNELKDNSIIEAKQRIVVLLDSVKNSEANVQLIRRYKIEIGKLKTERKLMFRKADSLIAANQTLAIERDSTISVLGETIRVVDSVTEQNQALAETIKIGSIVKTLDLIGSAVIVRKSGKLVETKRSGRADRIRACFTLAPNPIAEKGDRLLFVQVINSKNNLLGKKAVMEFEGATLNYSESTKVFYENEELDVCILVNASEADLVKGTYTVNVFDGSTQVASTTLELK